MPEPVALVVLPERGVVAHHVEAQLRALGSSHLVVRPIEQPRAEPGAGMRASHGEPVDVGARCRTYNERVARHYFVMIAADGFDGLLFPRLLRAVTVNVYRRCRCSPVTTCLVFGESNTCAFAGLVPSTYGVTT